MRDFVTAYYRDLPEHPNEAWTKLDTNCQNQTGLSQYLDYSIVIPHRFGVATVFPLVKGIFSGLFFGAVNGSGYADGAAPPVYSRREFRDLRVAGRHG
jgi:hypothetical protein